MNLITVSILFSTLSTYCRADSIDRHYWYQDAKHDLKQSLNKQQELNTNVAKNLVLVIGDGMGVTTTTAIRILRGQQEGKLGEETLLSWDQFPFTGFSKTYSTDLTTTDSAASGTAYHCGVKTKFQALGVDDNVIVKDCSTVEGSKVSSALDWALEAGKSVGIVSTDALVGASPAAAYAHAAHRLWLDDVGVKTYSGGSCKDLARQLVEDNLNIQVALGGGRQYFIPENESDPEYPSKTGNRQDGRNLFKEWEREQKKLGRKASVVYTKEQFDAVDTQEVDYLLGSFEMDRLMEETDRRINNSEPSISDLTEKAVKILSKNPNGFYLFIEGANIDKGHHANRPRKALEEGIALDKAVSKVLEMTDKRNTLVVVSADHSHAFNFGGYSDRGRSILSISASRYNYTNKDQQGNNFTILSYGNGPGYNEAQRANLTDEYFSVDRVYMSNFPLKDETHGGEDVAIYASGPMAHLFTGTHEQTFIPHGMAYAACIGCDKSHCDSSSASNIHQPFASIVLSACIILTQVW